MLTTAERSTTESSRGASTHQSARQAVPQDAHPAVAALRGLADRANHSPEARRTAGYAHLLNGGAAPVQRDATAPPRLNAGLPAALQAGVESLSGVPLDDVKVHYNSGKPARLQAHAYTQGLDIHVAPGPEKHLPHEAWHAAQQKQGRVQATAQLQDAALDDEAALEREADVMGAKAARVPAPTRRVLGGAAGTSHAPAVQRAPAVIQAVRYAELDGTTRTLFGTPEFKRFLARKGKSARAIADYTAEGSQVDWPDFEAWLSEYDQRSVELLPVRALMESVTPKLDDLDAAGLLDVIDRVHVLNDTDGREASLGPTRKFIELLNTRLAEKRAGSEPSIDTDVENERELGKGKIGTVHEVTFGNGSRSVFKPDVATSQGWSVAAERVGISHTDARASARAEAVSRLDQILGTNVIGASRMVTFKGQLGSLSDLASGQDLKKHRQQGNTDALYDDADVRRGLMNLQLLDTLTGEVDRHNENIFVDEGTRSVTGIDNDLSFGRKKQVDDRQGFSKGLPAYIDYDVAMRVMDLTPEALRKALDGLLTRREIEATVERLRVLQQYIQTLLQQPMTAGWENVDVSGLDDQNSYFY